MSNTDKVRALMAEAEKCPEHSWQRGVLEYKTTKLAVNSLPETLALLDICEDMTELPDQNNAAALAQRMAALQAKLEDELR